MNLIMRVFGHYEPLETPNLIMIVSLIVMEKGAGRDGRVGASVGSTGRVGSARGSGWLVEDV